MHSGVHMTMQGKIHKYGDNIDTDAIIPARYCTTIDIKELVLHCMEDLDTEFMNKIKFGDILVVGENFGCGSSREVAPLVIKASGVSCIIAKSFARIFYRNAINTGLTVIECSGFVDNASDNDEVEISPESGKIYNITKESKYIFPNDGILVEEIKRKGGLINYICLRDKNA